VSTPARASEIPTPALVVDLPAMERNIRRMAEFFAAGPCRLRPHFKAHKTPAIARRQLAAGSVSGLTCATVDELEVAAGFCDDLLLANEIVDAQKCRRAAALARRVRVTIAVDSDGGVEALSAAARAEGVTFGVLIDLDVGQGRCGVMPGDDAVALATRAARTPGLVLRGVMGYEGHLQPVADRAERGARARAAMQPLVETAHRMRAEGLGCEIVSAGGTGTYDISGRVPGITEIQAGSYVLMDSDYGRLGLPFEQALFVLGTVISRPVPTRIVADCGHKACSKDHGLPEVEDLPGATVTALNDEHAVIAVPASARIAPGERIRLRPSHIDPTINLHDVLYALEGDGVVDVWPVAARGYGQPRALST
jgi:D-serine deaminase-like pyridoxal phosphate-dependent protein